MPNKKKGFIKSDLLAPLQFKRYSVRKGKGFRNFSRLNFIPSWELRWSMYLNISPWNKFGFVREINLGKNPQCEHARVYWCDATQCVHYPAKKKTRPKCDGGNKHFAWLGIIIMSMLPNWGLLHRTAHRAILKKSNQKIASYFSSSISYITALLLAFLDNIVILIKSMNCHKEGIREHSHTV